MRKILLSILGCVACVSTMTSDDAHAQEFSATAIADATELDRRYLDHPRVRGTLGPRHRLLAKVGDDGAVGVNRDVSRSIDGRWYIEAQRFAYYLILAGLQRGDDDLLAAGARVIDWGFARQAADGSFPGTGDPFHSLSFFVDATAHSILLLEQAEQSVVSHAQMDAWRRGLARAAQWMVTIDWQRGLNANRPYAHRRFLVASALGLTALVTGNPSLMAHVDAQVADGLALQTATGIFPEKGGHDTSYQMVGMIYAARLLVYFPQAPWHGDLADAVERAIHWQITRIDPESGEVSTVSNTRTGPDADDRGRSGRPKAVDYPRQVRALAYSGQWFERADWIELAGQVQAFRQR